ncbi:MAG: AcrB/AcrD/AcrF family protein [Helicobacteraceae bacterium]|nr:AcrB/AcrD/AcrF family protein [Helicobacteraceae bacterium]
MRALLEYFIINKRLSYVLMIFLAYMGYNAYINIPKEMFPEVSLDKISVRGAYAGTSASNMDKLAVRDLEDGMANISGILKSETVITPGFFTITLTLDSNIDKDRTLSKIQDTISTIRQYLPSDMNEPTAKIVDKIKPLMKVSVSSPNLSNSELIVIAQDVKSKLAKTKGVSDITIYGDSNEEVLIALNSDTLLAYELDATAVINAIRNISYTFPIGDIEESGNFVYISTVNGASSVKGYENTLLKIGDKFVRLGDVAKVSIHYPQDNTIATFNAANTITLKLSKASEADAIALSQTIHEYIETIKNKYEGAVFDIYGDTSKKVKDRLNTIVSNLMFGMVLVFLSIYVLINLRLAMIVTLGIPFAFTIGLLFIYYGGYSINIVSLLGALIVIGIVVDDAIVVGENIQRYIDEGLDNHEAAIKGTMEMVLPVTLATLTTAAAFLPIFMMSGEIRLFLILVPITVIMILVGSLIESFLFLPLHAKELLKKSEDSINWKPLQERYELALRFLIKRKKLSLTLFLVIIPLLTFGTLKSMNFQFFPNFDGSNLYISGKLNINTPIEDTASISQEIEKELLNYKDEFSIKSISTVAGYRRSLAGDTQLNNSVFYITLELFDRTPQSWIDAYINPLLNFSFNFNDPEKIREKQTYQLSPRLNEIIVKYKDKYNMIELGVKEDKAGLIKSDIQINLSGLDDQTLETAVNTLENELKKVQYVTDTSNNVNYGKMEYKIKINALGEQLGLSEAGVATLLSNYFLGTKKATTFNEIGVMEIKTEDQNKDRVNTLMNFRIALSDGRVVSLSDIAEIVKRLDYEKIEKLDGNIIKTVYASIDKRHTTAGEVLENLNNTIESLQKDGINIKLLGEDEKKAELKSDMKKAASIAIFLIVITLLLIFNKMKYVFMVISVIPLSILGALLGHKLLGMNLAMPSVIGILGLAGVVINDAIIMLSFLHGTHENEEFFKRAKQRLRPILITSITTFLGLFTLIFYATGQAVILQPIAISIGFGLLWGTVLNLLYLPTLYALVNNISHKKDN